MQTFAILGGLYTFVSCFMKRLRMKDDRAHLLAVLLRCSLLLPAAMHELL